MTRHQFVNAARVVRRVALIVMIVGFTLSLISRAMMSTSHAAAPQRTVIAPGVSQIATISPDTTIGY